MPRDIVTILARPVVGGSMDAGAAAYRHVAPTDAALSALDLAATRGDGIFETISVGHGHPQAFDAHLARFARSAAMLDLPAPDLDAWRAAILATVGAIDPVPEAYVKTVLSRGVEGANEPTGWCYGAPSPDFTRERTEGVRVVLLDRGVRSDVALTAPWLLAGAKTLSYAINRAAHREAARRGADDVVFVSSEGVLLEGPTSTLVYRVGDTLVTPGPDLGILDGTTQANVFRFAAQRGLATRVERAGPEALRSADASWLVSSVRYAAPIAALDGEARPVDAAFTADLNAWLLGLTS